MGIAILDCLIRLHGNDIVHCDVKPENILLSKGDGDAHAHLADFGSAQALNKDGGPRLFTRLGTVDCWARELVRNRSYDEKVDMWALGVTICYMKMRAFPFSDPSSQWSQFEKKVLAGDYTQWQFDLVKAAPDFWDLIDGLLTVDRDDQLSAEMAKVHPFFRRDAGDIGIQTQLHSKSRKRSRHVRCNA
jgi:serine/threonine protein kinase